MNPDEWTPTVDSAFWDCAQRTLREFGGGREVYRRGDRDVR